MTKVCTSCKTQKPVSSFARKGRGDGLVGVALSIDHDHECCPKLPLCGNCTRGLLCRSCNVALGSAKDSPEILRALASYVEADR